LQYFGGFSKAFAGSGEFAGRRIARMTGAIMKRIALILLAAFPFSFVVSARPPETKPSLTPTQLLGRRIFQQRCAVCHTQVTAVNPMYGITLYKDLVDGNEDMIRDYIRNGSQKMPGFKYGLEPSEIDAIVEYLKTVPKPAPRTAAAKGEGPVD
jgi:mono/diheme cytochrome c family protein